MTNMIDAKFGIHPQALRLHEERAKIISTNMANKSTPNFQAKDIDFNSALKDLKDQMSVAGKTSTSMQAQGMQVNDVLLNNLKFRTAVQPSVDGNTVDSNVENAAFAENSVRYLASLNFLTDRVKGLMLAIKGH